MKTFHFTLLALLLAAPASQANWTEQPVQTAGTLAVVQAIDENLAWTVGDNRQVFRTTDGGANWEPRFTPSNGDLRGLWAFDANRCVVASTDGIFWRTTDSGHTWIDVHHANTFIDGIHFFDDLNGWAIGDPVGGQWVIRVTTDGGATWAPGSAPPTAQGGGITRSLSWIGTQIGAFGTSQHILWRTSNGGQNWTPISMASTEVSGLVLSPGGIGLVGGGDDLLERSTDSGATWQIIPSPTSARLFTFDWIGSTNEVWGSTTAAGLFHSSDAGLSWQQHLLGPSYFPQDLDFANSNVGWSVGFGPVAGRIFRYSATTGVDAAESGAVASLTIDVAPNPFSSAVTFTARGAERGPIALRIFDVAGREIARLRSASPGALDLRWDGRNRAGKRVPAGAYFWQLEMSGERMQGKVVLAAP